jgi:ribonuclease P protein component
MPAAPRVASVWPSEPAPAQRTAPAAVQRLKTRPQFQAALAGPTVARTAHFALHQLLLAPDQLQACMPPAHEGLACAVSDGADELFAGPMQAWLGAMTPKRWARRAVTRNAIRRQVYALGHAYAGQLPCAAHVVRLRAGFDRQRFPSAWSQPLRLLVRDELVDLFERALRKASP